MDRPTTACKVLLIAIPVFLAAAAAESQSGNRDDDERSLAQLGREPIAVADKAYELAMRRYQGGFGDEEALVWLRRRAEAHLDGPQSKARRMEFLTEYVHKLKGHETMVNERVGQARSSSIPLEEANYFRLEGEMWLLKAQEQ